MIYAAYASIYAAIGQGAFTETLVARILASLPAPPARALDLACGAGAATLALATAGATVVGVDRSPQMLGIARARARDRRLPVQFLEADIRFLPIANGHAPAGGHAQGGEHSQDEASSFLLPPSSFELVTCLYDSLNYLTSDGELEQALAGAGALLAPDGRLFFDLNTEAELAAWDDVDQVVHDAGGILVYNRLSYNQISRLAYGRIVWFTFDGERWWRGEETHVERAWRASEVAAALAAAGLRLVARRTPSWEPAGPDAPRIVYEAVKEQGARRQDR